MCEAAQHRRHWLSLDTRHGAVQRDRTCAPCVTYFKHVRTGVTYPTVSVEGGGLCLENVLASSNFRNRLKNIVKFEYACTRVGIKSRQKRSYLHTARDRRYVKYWHVGYFCRNTFFLIISLSTLCARCIELCWDFCSIYSQFFFHGKCQGFNNFLVINYSQQNLTILF